ncbi:Hypothetical_protein [Hexamita inflata]|uniref:Hypothetical_protein n=1 Tax=Hexamita inflata TaxID=28002 RepID=A0AA86NVL1_9EUKA|nr:Hypothetical protein HINF_LOCUS14458 [Hexamita inflata]
MNSQIFLTPNVGGYTILKHQDGRDEAYCELFVPYCLSHLVLILDLVSKLNFGTRNYQGTISAAEDANPLLRQLSNRIHYRFVFEVQMLQKYLKECNWLLSAYHRIRATW